MGGVTAVAGVGKAPALLAAMEPAADGRGDSSTGI